MRRCGKNRAARAAALVAGSLVAASPASAAVVLSDGHVDFAARIVDGALRSQVKDGTVSPAVWREPSEVVLALGPRARTTVPAKPPTPGLGTPGAPVWVMSQVQQTGVPWLGWNTEALSAAAVDGPVRWSLDAVAGPGAVTVFQTGAFGAGDVLFDSSDGLPDQRDVPVGVHAHGNWTFSARGQYSLTFTMRATAADGRALIDTQRLAITVDEPAVAPRPVEQPTSPAGPGDPAAGGGNPAPASGSPSPAGSTPQRGGELPPTDPLRVRSASVRGHTLKLRLRLAVSSKVKVKVRRNERTVASSRRVVVSAKRSAVALRLSRKLTRGTYSVAVTATPSRGSRAAVTRTAKLKVR